MPRKVRAASRLLLDWTVASPFLVGTSGWIYQHWKGLFYPPRLASRRWLTYRRGAPPVRRGQRHLLLADAALRVPGVARGRAARVRVRAEGQPLHHAHAEARELPRAARELLRVGRSAPGPDARPRAVAAPAAAPLPRRARGRVLRGPAARRRRGGAVGAAPRLADDGTRRADGAGRPRHAAPPRRGDPPRELALGRGAAPARAPLNRARRRRHRVPTSALARAHVARARLRAAPRRAAASTRAATPSTSCRSGRGARGSGLARARRWPCTSTTTAMPRRRRTRCACGRS
jgi:hypothetical protein